MRLEPTAPLHDTNKIKSSFNQGNWLMGANLDPVVPGVGHDDLVPGVGVDIPGVGELTGLVTLGAKGQKKLALDGENLMDKFFNMRANIC